MNDSASYTQVTGKLDLINRQDAISREFVKIEISYPKFTSKEHKGKPYYAIKYIENGKNCVIGFGTYSIEMLSCYIKKYFIMPSAEPEQRWIPCGERLPEEGERVLATHLGGVNPNKQVIEHIYQCGKFTYGWDMDMNVDSPTFGQRYMGEVIAWMPLPEPYKGGEQDG